MTIFIRFLLLSALTLLALPVRAELPLDAYRLLQSEAPEHLEITVAEVKLAESQGRTAVTLKVRVVAVIATASGVKPDDIISIDYDILRQAHPGPSSPPVLAVGMTVPAYLRRQGTTFLCAAGGKSFQRLPPLGRPTSSQPQKAKPD